MAWSTRAAHDTSLTTLARPRKKLSSGRIAATAWSSTPSAKPYGIRSGDLLNSFFKQNPHTVGILFEKAIPKELFSVGVGAAFPGDAAASSQTGQRIENDQGKDGGAQRLRQRPTGANAEKSVHPSPVSERRAKQPPS